MLRVDVLFGPHHPAVAGEEKRRSDDRGDRQWTRVGRSAPRQRAQAKKRAGEQEANPSHQERREGLDRELDRQIGRAPDHVDQGECEQQPSAGFARRGAPPPGSIGSPATSGVGFQTERKLVSSLTVPRTIVERV